MKKVIAAGLVVLALSGCGSVKEGFEEGKTGKSTEQRYENAARAKDDTGALDDLTSEELVRLGKTTCAADFNRADPPGDFTKLPQRAYQAILDAAAQELC
ncbi:MAG: hypothetical protein Q8K63_06485 [Acidimicrobiales bacterium]|nr:hypothetical protein [Acidimicrobiales bacterium]